MSEMETLPDITNCKNGPGCTCWELMCPPCSEQIKSLKRLCDQFAYQATEDREEIHRLKVLLRRAEPWVGIGVTVDIDPEEYKLVDRLREDISRKTREEK